MKTVRDKSLSAVRLRPIEIDLDFPRPKRNTSEGNASEYYRSFSRIVRQAAKDGIPHLLVVLYVRVSSGKQGRDGNLDHQLSYLRKRVQRIAAKYGVTIEIVGEFDEEVSAWKLWASGRPELMKASKCARKHDAVLVALNTSRLVRNRHHARGVMPTVSDFEDLISLVGNVQLATILPPGRQEDRSQDTVRGHKAKDARPGRPPNKVPGHKRNRRMQFKLPVIRLMKQGKGNREIARELGLPEKTVRDWRQRYRKYWGASFSGQKSRK